MTLHEEKQRFLEEKCYGEAIPLHDMPKVLEPCWLYHGGASIDKNAILILRHEGRFPRYESEIVNIHQEVIVTNKSTAQLIREYAKVHCVDVRTLKDFFRTLDGKCTYKLPYMSAHAFFIPLEGDSGKNVDYINLATVDEIYRISKYKSGVRFCNQMEVELPVSYVKLKDLVVKYLKIYAIYYSCDNPHEINVFSNWKGKCHLKVMDTIDVQVQLSISKNAGRIKTKSKFKCEASDEDKKEISDDYYDNN